MMMRRLTLAKPSARFGRTSRQIGVSARDGHSDAVYVLVGLASAGEDVYTGNRSSVRGRRRDQRATVLELRGATRTAAVDFDGQRGGKTHSAAVRSLCNGALHWAGSRGAQARGVVLRGC